MHLLELRLRNWGPHETFEARIDPQARTIAIAGGNDAGKTSLINAIRQAFAPPTGGLGRRAILDGQTEALIEVRFELAGQTHDLSKRLTLGKRRRARSGEPELETAITLDGAKFSATALEAFFAERGLEPRRFLPVMINPQEAIHRFLRLTLAARNEELRHVLELDLIDKLHAQLKTQTDALERGQEAQEAALSGQLGTLTAIQERHGRREAELRQALEALGAAGEGALPLDRIGADAQRFLSGKAALLTLGPEIANLEGLLEHKRLAAGQKAQALEALEAQRPGQDPDALVQTFQDAQAELHRLERAQKTLELQDLRTSAETLRAQTARADALRADVRAARARQDLRAKRRALQETLRAREEEARAHAAVIQLPGFLPGNPGVERLLADLAAATEAQQAELARLRQELQAAGLDPHAGALDAQLERARQGALQRRRDLEAALNAPAPREIKAWSRRAFNPAKPAPARCPLCLQNLPGGAAARALQHHLQAAEAAGDAPDDGPTLLALQQVERLLEFELPALQNKAARAQALEAALTPSTPPEALRALLSASQAAARARSDLDAGPAPEDGAEQDARLAELENDLLALHRKEGELAQTQTRLGHLETELASLPPAQPYPGLSRETLQLLKAARQTSMDEARNRLQEGQRLQRERERFQRELASLQGEAKQLEQTLAQRRDDYQRQAALREEDALPSARPGAALPDGEYPLARHWLEQAQRKTQLEAALRQATQERHAAAAELAQAQRALQSRQRQRGILEEARAARDFLSPEGAVKRILQRVLQQVLQRANPLAQDLQLGLQFRMDANLEILAVQTRHGRTVERPADELGCGKATLAGMCFTLSAAHLLFPTLRTLIFDEPSAPLQSHLKKHFAAFLTRLSRYEAVQGFAQARQIIVVEHDDEVSSACDQTIPVG